MYEEKTSSTGIIRCVTEELGKARACERCGGEKCWDWGLKEHCLGLRKKAFVENKEEETKA